MTTWIDQQDQAKVEHAIARLHETNSEMLRYANGDERFALWLSLVDRAVGRLVGIGLFDLEDWMSRDAYDAGMRPSEAAREALLNDETFGAWAEEAFADSE